MMNAIKIFKKVIESIFGVLEMILFYEDENYKTKNEFKMKKMY